MPVGEEYRVLRQQLRKPVVGQVHLQPALADQQDPAAELLHVVDVVGGNQHAQPLLRRQIMQHVAEDALALDVQPQGRLVQNQQLRLIEERTEQLRPQALAQRERRHALVQKVLAAEDVRITCQILLKGPLWNAVDTLEQPRGIHDRQVINQVRLAAQIDADAPLIPGAETQRVNAQHAHRPRRGADDAQQQLDQRALAGAVGAQHADNLPLAHREVHILQGIAGLGLVFLRQMVDLNE